jgi:hypothetical protein
MKTPDLCSEWQSSLISPPQHSAGKKQVTVFYDSARKCYWIQNARNNWMEINETALKRYLCEAGYWSQRFHGEALSEVDAKIIEVQRHHDVNLAGPLAGYRSGLIEMCGNRILVTTAPKLILPQPGDCPLMETLLDNLFHLPEIDQRPYVKGWIKCAVESLSSGQFRPGQALVMAGERGSGKSLLQNIYTEILGGRSAKPHRYMTGATEFNGELFGAEHLCIEDDVASTQLQMRRTFGSRIKEFTVNRDQSWHAKNRQAMTLRPFWRLSISLNDEPENLLILPPLDESLVDKMMLLKAQKRPLPMPTDTLEQREAFWKALIAELPAFIWQLMRWEIPLELRCPRFGIKHYHHPELLAGIETLAPESRLLSLIDAVLFPPEDEEVGRLRVRRDKPAVIIRSAIEIERALLGSHTFAREATQLLSWSGATGTYLGRLASKRPDRLKGVRKAQTRLWQINPPETD